MLILILINNQYLQNVVFSFEKGWNGQNHSPSGSHHLIKEFLPQRNSPSALWGEEFVAHPPPPPPAAHPTSQGYFENPNLNLILLFECNY